MPILFGSQVVKQSPASSIFGAVEVLFHLLAGSFYPPSLAAEEGVKSARVVLPIGMHGQRCRIACTSLQQQCYTGAINPFFSR